MTSNAFDNPLPEQIEPLREANARLRAELAERKQTEEALRLALRASRTGLWDWNVQEGEIYFSAEWKAQIGYEDHEVPNSIGEWERRLHPSDRQWVLSKLSAYLTDQWSNYEVEFRLQHKDGSYRWILSRAKLFTDYAGRPMRMLGSHVDITERKRTEEALRRSEKLYRLLARNFPNGGVALFDDELRYLVADGTELARVGLSKEGLEGRTIWEVFPPDVSKALEPVYRTALAGNSTVEEISLRGNTYLRHAVPVSDERGEIIGGMVMSQDITDRKRMEDALRTAELEYRTLVESVQAIVWRADARTLQFSFVSKEAEHLLGYPAEQWTTDPEFWRNHIYPDDRDLAVSSCMRATEEARDHVFEYRMVAADGRVVWLRDIVRVVAEGDAVRELLGVMVDITERKKAEELVRQSEKRFRTLAETTPSAIVVYNFNDGRIRYVNSAMQEIFGYSQSELLSTTIWDLVHPDSIAAVTARREARLRGEDVAPRIELKLITKNGEARWVDQSAAPIEFEGNAAMICTAFDITERKRAEEALRLSEERYRLIVENQTEFIVKWRPDGTRTFVNDSYSRYFGLTENECIGTSFFPLIAPEFRDEIELRTKGLTPDAPEYTEEHLSVARDEMRWQQWKNRGIFDSEGKLVELLSTGRDITERKSAEEALQESESRGRRLNERFSLAVESAGIGVWDLDLLNNELTWDHQMNRLYQIETIGFSGAYNAWSERVHSDDLSRVEHEVQDAIRGVKAFDTDFRILWPGGEERNIKAFARVVRDEQGKPIRMTGINYDITDRKRAERSLRESEAQYRALVENTPDIIARFDCDSRYLFVNSAVSQVSARALDGFVGKRPSEVGFSEDQAAFREGVIRRVFTTRKPFETEFEFEGPTGMSIFEWRVYPEFDAAGNIQSVLSINRDITERKRAEEEVTQSRELLRALSARLQSIREEERTMIAREIHDELGQALTGLKMDLSSLQKSLRKTGELDLSRLTEKTTTMGQLIDSTIQTVRKIATDLRPGILDDLGLVAAIEWQSQDFEKRTGIKCNFAPGMDDLDLNAERSTTLFRILQETLTNVARHSEATEVIVTLDRDENDLALEIRDNGKGISQTEISGRRSLGLLGMRERVQRLGGDLTISGAPGEGTIVTARIPLTSEQMEPTRQ
jgi:PAS domain S-box-containing protein